MEKGRAGRGQGKERQRKKSLLKLWCIKSPGQERENSKRMCSLSLRTKTQALWSR